METLKKVLVWRIISFITVWLLTLAWTGNIIQSSTLTIVAQTTLFILHWIFEHTWNVFIGSDT